MRVEKIATRQIENANRNSKRVGLTGLEPVTLRLSSACSNQLSYRPGSRLRRGIFEFRLSIFDLEQLARFARIYLNRQSQIANRKFNTNMSAFAMATARQLRTLSGLEARGFEPLTSSLQSWRSTN